MKNKRIFLDYNSTTPVDPAVLEVMIPFFTEKFGNAASRNHSYGLEANEAVQLAREQVANLINCDSDEIIFTSGATESINLAIKGIAEARKKLGCHIITLKTEHKAVLDSCHHLEKLGYKISYLDVLPNGILDLKILNETLKDDTILVVVMHANNEIGVIQPIKEISNICRNNNVPLFVDAAQSVGKIPVNVKELGADLLSISAHKMYGPKGIGALYINGENHSLDISCQMDGGGHENGYRSGTLNVPGIVGFGKAAEISKKIIYEEMNRILSYRNLLLNGIMARIDGVYLNGDLESRLPGNLNLSFDGVNGDSLLLSMDEIAVSNGSACTSEVIEPSYVLKALGVEDGLANASIRFGLGRFTTKDEIEYTVDRVSSIVTQLREMTTLKKKFHFN